MTMPPVERRSPASLSSSTSTRSCSIRIGLLSPTSVSCPTSAGDATDHDEQADEPDHPADDLEDVLGARVAVLVDERRLHGRDLAAHDVLRTGAVDQLVDRGRETLAGLLDLALQRLGALLGHGCSSSTG